MLEWMNTKSIPPDGPYGPLSFHINTYLTHVREQGYAQGSICEQVCTLKMLGRWLVRTGRGVQDLDETASREFLRQAVKRSYIKNAAHPGPKDCIPWNPAQPCAGWMPPKLAALDSPRLKNAAPRGG